MNLLRIVVVIALVLAMGSLCCPPPLPDAGPADGGTPEECFIGDKDGEAEIHIIVRTAEGTDFVDVADGDQVPLILPPQGGKVTLIGVRARNVSCNMQMNAGLFDDCQAPPRVIGREGRPIELEEGPDGFGVPVQKDQLQNYANIPVCPAFSSTRDGDGEPYRLEMRVTEVKRAGEEEPRTHVFTATVTPFCAQAEIEDECQCECDVDLITGIPRDQQCPTINDNDEPPRVCDPPAPPGD